MQIRIIRSRGVTILSCHGPLVLGRAASRLRKVALRALAVRQVVALDLSGVTQMDAHAIGVLADLYVFSRASGSVLLLAGLSDRAQRLLHLTRLDRFIPVVTTSGAADSGSRHPFGPVPAGGHDDERRRSVSAVSHGA